MRIAIGGLFVLVLAACNKPDMDECRKALDNMQHILGTENISKNGDNEGDVRRCRGASTKEAVACAIAAKTRAELDKCAFNQTKSKKHDSDDDGSAGSAVK